MEFLLMPIHQCHAQRPLCGGTCAYACTTTRCALPQRGFTFDSARLASATQPTLGNGCRQGATHNVGCTFFRPHHYPPKRNRRGGACVPARTSAQRHFHAKIHALCAGDERRMRPCRATRAGTQAPPLPISVIFFHTISYKQNNHLRAIPHKQNT